MIKIINSQEAKCSNTNNEETKINDYITEFNFPVRATEDVDALEKKLADKEFQCKIMQCEIGLKRR